MTKEKEKKKIMITGITGRMGRAIMTGLYAKENLSIVGAVGKKNHIGEDIVSLLGLKGEPLIIQDNLSKTIQEKRPDLLIDFTTAKESLGIIESALHHNLPVISGTTGFGEEGMVLLKKLVNQKDGSIILAPNFSLGAILMMKLSLLAAPFFKDAEIIELHHEKKRDAPSGTAIRTAELLSTSFKEKKDTWPSQGASFQGIQIHSIRLPGLLAHQEVLFGNEGETLRIRHDSSHHSSFLAGILMAIDKIDRVRGLIYGLENLIHFQIEE